MHSDANARITVSTYSSSNYNQNQFTQENRNKILMIIISYLCVVVAPLKGTSSIRKHSENTKEYKKTNRNYWRGWPKFIKFVIIKNCIHMCGSVRAVHRIIWLGFNSHAFHWLTGDRMRNKRNDWFMKWTVNWFHIITEAAQFQSLMLHPFHLPHQIGRWL